jgi:hypothetical protein
MTRRRFQFRLRTLMIGVTLLAIASGYVGREVEIVHVRRAELDRNVNLRVQFRPTDEYGAINWIRRALGDKTLYGIFVPKQTEPAEIARLHAIFPEADIRLSDSKEVPPLAQWLQRPGRPSSP